MINGSCPRCQFIGVMVSNVSNKIFLVATHTMLITDSASMLLKGQA